MIDLEDWILPHGEPFRFIGKCKGINFNNDTSLKLAECTSSLSISKEHPIYKGHFPDNPITPGVIYIEMIAQNLAYILQEYVKKKKIEIKKGDVKCFIVGIEKCKFSKSSGPEEFLTVHTKVKQSIGNVIKIEGSISNELGESIATCSGITVYLEINGVKL